MRTLMLAVYALLVCSLFFILAGCVESPPQEELVEVNDEKGVQGEIEEVTLHANNCKAMR